MLLSSPSSSSCLGVFSTFLSNWSDSKAYAAFPPKTLLILHLPRIEHSRSCSGTIEMGLIFLSSSSGPHMLYSMCKPMLFSCVATAVANFSKNTLYIIHWILEWRRQSQMFLVPVCCLLNSCILLIPLFWDKLL